MIQLYFLAIMFMCSFIAVNYSDLATSVLVLGYKWVIAISAFLLFFFGGVSIICYVRTKKTKKKSKMRWEINEFHESESYNSADNDQQSVYPNWLKDRTEMIFSHKCVQICNDLGKGNYGAVQKAKLTQGKAVWVVIFE